MKPRHQTIRAIGIKILLIIAWLAAGESLFPSPVDPSSRRQVILNDDGGWNWLQDRRAVAAGDTVYVGSVATGWREPRRAGDVDVVAYDLRTGETQRTTVHHEEDRAEKRRWADDHNAPALCILPGGGLVAMYAEHTMEPRLYFRRHSGAWSAEQEIALPEGSRAAIPTLLFTGGASPRLWAMYRGLLDPDTPAALWSDDGGIGWQSAGFVMAPRPRRGETDAYIKYAADREGHVALTYTFGHRTNFGNALFAAAYDGTPVRSPELIFRSAASDVACPSDCVFDAQGRLCIAYSVQVNRPASGPPGSDHRYRFARREHGRWTDREIAFAGSAIHHVANDSCTGLIVIDPDDSDQVFAAADADPTTGAPLISRSDGKRHYELFQGSLGTDRARWRPITHDSTADNVRPLVVHAGGRRLILWLRGSMIMPDDYRFEVVALPL